MEPFQFPHPLYLSAVRYAVAYPVEAFEVRSTSDTSLTFSWRQPSIGAHLTTGYNLTCVPLLSGIPSPQSLPLLAPTRSSATLSGFFSGVRYNCSISTISQRGSSLPVSLTLYTNETAPSGSPKIEVVPGEREVVFSWSPPPLTERNGVITSYTLSCSPSPSSLPHSPTSQSGPQTVAGFSPNTHYSCSLVASNTQGSGPPANTSFTTQQDYSFFQLRLGKVPYFLFEEISSERSLKLEHITAAVVKELKSSCSECGPEMIDNQLFVCYLESPSFLMYRARLEGTSETDSGSLVSLIEAWVRGGGASLILTGVLMTLDSHCSVAISSLSQPPQCSPSSTPTATSSPSTDMPPVERSSDEEPAQVYDAIIGGIVAVVLIVAITIAVITIVFLVLKERRGGASLRSSNEASAVTESGVIHTSTNTAYGKVEREQEYELVDFSHGEPPPPPAELEEIYEVPLSSASAPSQPLPLILPPPIPETEEDTLYDAIPENQ
ncbi:Netrin receptor DCC [Geodia barretti]|uniref:Netrin receptor DCC n=1 Tax=Geodia barretti TaxID=519541 RepID=A0AA35TIK5_GEOBA|nr:Netrin receptor DCC [Geodia barretti]